MKHEINKKQEMNFNSLVAAIQQVHHELSAQASRAVNVSLTMRNWFIGCYIAEYELHGADRTGASLEPICACLRYPAKHPLPDTNKSRSPIGRASVCVVPGTKNWRFSDRTTITSTNALIIF